MPSVNGCNHLARTAQELGRLTKSALFKQVLNYCSTKTVTQSGASLPLLPCPCSARAVAVHSLIVRSGQDQNTAEHGYIYKFGNKVVCLVSFSDFLVNLGKNCLSYRARRPYKRTGAMKDSQRLAQLAGEHLRNVLCLINWN